jgi:hypothetical protein
LIHEQQNSDRFEPIHCTLTCWFSQIEHDITELTIDPGENQSPTVPQIMSFPVGFADWIQATMIGFLCQRQIEIPEKLSIRSALLLLVWLFVWSRDIFRSWMERSLHRRVDNWLWLVDPIKLNITFLIDYKDRWWYVRWPSSSEAALLDASEAECQEYECECGLNQVQIQVFVLALFQVINYDKTTIGRWSIWVLFHLCAEG